MRATPIPAIAALLPGLLWGANLRVTSVRTWPLGESTRVVIQVSDDFEYKSDRLHNPERIFFDIVGARPYFDGKRLFKQDLDDKLVKRVRVAETTPGVTRIVLEVDGPVDFNAGRMSNPERLVVELRRGTGTPAIPPLPAPLAAPEAKSPETLPPPPTTTTPSASTTLPAVLPKPARATAPPLTASQPASAPPVISVPAPAPAKPVPQTAAETARGARHRSDGSSSLIRALGLKISRVVIDPGHGGHDQGTVGRRGLMEKELVLDLSQRLGKLIQERLGSEIIYTRSDDTFIPLEGRTALANQRKADLFISLHANSSPAPRIAGVETFYLNFTTDSDALDVAARENASSQKSISELQDVLKKISLQEKIEESRELAGRVQTSLYSTSARYVAGSRNRGVKKAPFMVLVGATMPAVLVEVGFLSNLGEERLLKKPEHRQRVAEAIYRGIARYAEGLSHFQVAKAEE